MGAVNITNCFEEAILNKFGSLVQRFSFGFEATNQVVITLCASNFNAVFQQLAQVVTVNLSNLGGVGAIAADSKHG
ncbi:MAG TPA: hypothetical protein V6D46_02095 [Coleofasciculaceae cyanobacterium]